MNRIAFLLVAIFALSATSVVAQIGSSAPELKFLWHSWKQIHNKVYSEVEEMKRFALFVENYFQVVSYNAMNTGVKLALNQFSDLTEEEFKSQYANGLNIAQERQTEDFLNIDYSILALPASADWRSKGAVTPIKNQANCGSCWAFSATGALEGLNFITSGKLLSFSEQQLVDCDKKSHGCNGGLMDYAFGYTAQNGIEIEADYPYKAVNQKCAADASKANHVNKGFQNVAKRNPDALKAAIAVQPVSVAIQADQTVFRNYKSGVIKSGCGPLLNHGVLAVGYGTFDGEEAFIVKNSWADTWGNNGYVLISTDKTPNVGGGACGILLDPSYPTA